MANARPAAEVNHSRRRREIIDVAARLFAERGFHGTSMDDIARELGILKGSLYYWIESKEALLSEVLEGALIQDIDEGREIATRPIPAAERLRLLIRNHIDSWIENPNNFNVFLSEFRFLDKGGFAPWAQEKETLEQLFKQVVREGIESGEFKADPVDLSIIVNSIFGITNWFPRWYRADSWASPGYIADVMADLVLTGLTSSPRPNRRD
jgi:AcrR family transcriptional regulator